MANGKVTYRTLHKVGVQGVRGGIGLVSARQKTNHRKENLRRRTDLGTQRPTLQEWFSAGKDAFTYGASVRRALEAPRETVL